MKQLFKKLGWTSLLLAVALAAVTSSQRSVAQDQNGDQDDPPSRVARLGYLQGSISFQPAGENEWVGAVPNRPMTTGDQLWSDRDSRAEVELGSSVIRLAANTGFSFLNLDDNTVQIQLTSGALNIHVRDMDENDVYEIDTPNQAFTILQPGSYRVEASEDGTYTVISVREGRGDSTGNGQTFTVHVGQRATFSGTDALNADVEEMGNPDDFDTWAYARDHRYENSRSAAYVSRRLVGYEDLDDNGDWRDDGQYGHVWYPRVAVGWAPYREGHWDWIAPWGWTWVDDAPWGYAPFHYGRWVTVGGRWGWIAGPAAVRPVYAPALVVFVGGSPGLGGNVAWFPLGPREVFVPSYHVSAGYVNRVNVSNTTVNVTQVTNVYNTTIINRTTNVTNITYVNRNVQGAVTAVPQRAFVSAQPVGRAVVAVNARDMASARMTTTAAVAPQRESVMGSRFNTAGRVAAPPAAVANRQVIAKVAPPPAPVSFARQQQALAANPGQPLARREEQTMRPAVAAGTPARPTVRVAPPSKPAMPVTSAPRPSNQPGQANAPHPGQPANARPNQAMPNQPAANQPTNQPAPNQPAANQRPNHERPADRPTPNNPAPSATPNPNSRPEPNRPEANRPEPTRPVTVPNNQPAPNQRPEPNPQANHPEPSRPEPNRPQPDRPTPDAPRNDRPTATQPNQTNPNRPQPNRPDADRPDATRPAPNRPVTPPNNRPVQPPASVQPAQRPATPPQRTPPPTQAKPAPQQKQKPLTPEEKKQQDEERKKEQKPQ